MEHTISSPCQPDGPAELIITVDKIGSRQEGVDEMVVDEMGSKQSVDKPNKCAYLPKHILL